MGILCILKKGRGFDMNRADKKVKHITKKLMKYGYDCSFLPYNYEHFIELEPKHYNSYRHIRNIVRHELKNLTLESLLRGWFMPF